MFDRFVINILLMIDPSIFILMLLPAALVAKERVTIQRERRHPHWLVLVAMILAVTATSILGCRNYLHVQSEQLSNFPPPILISMFLPLILIVVQRLTIRDVHRHPRWLLPCAAALVVLVVAILGCRYIFWWTRPGWI